MIDRKSNCRRFQTEIIPTYLFKDCDKNYYLYEKESGTAWEEGGEGESFGEFMLYLLDYHELVILARGVKISNTHTRL